MNYTFKEMESMANYLGKVYRKDIMTTAYGIEEEESTYCRLELRVSIHQALSKMKKEEREIILREYLLQDNVLKGRCPEEERADKQAKNIALCTFFSLLK